MKKEDGGKGEDHGQKDEKVVDDATPKDTMEELLKEANRMLKGSSAKGEEDVEDTKEKKLAAMQTQLDELRKMKVLRLSRITKDDCPYGLLDSGATHPMRERRKGEDLQKYEEVLVTLANGSQTKMRMTEKGVMVMDEEGVEPIIPMSMLTEKMGYSILGREV